MNRMLPLIFALLSSAATAAPFAYIPSYSGDDITIIDLATDTAIEQTIPTSLSGNTAIAVSPEGVRLYVNNNQDSISVFNRETYTEITTIAVEEWATGLALTPDGRYLYVTNGNSNNVSVIDTDALKVVGNPIPVQATPRHALASPNGQYIFIAGDNGLVEIIEVSSQSKINEFAFPGMVTAMEISPDSTQLYASYYDYDEGAYTGYLKIVDLSQGTVSDAIATGGSSPTSMAYLPNSDRIYISHAISGSESDQGTVNVFDMNTQTLVGNPIPVGEFSSGISAHPDGSKIYVTSLNENNVRVIETTQNFVMQDPIPTGRSPYAFGHFIMPYYNFSPPSYKGLSGNWAIEGHNGEGLQIQVLDGGLMLFFWFTYNTQAEPYWLLTQSPVQLESNWGAFTMVFPNGSTFGDNYDENQFSTHVWGEVELEFTDCNHAQMDFQSDLGFGSGSYNLIRVTATEDNTCLP